MNVKRFLMAAAAAFGMIFVLDSAVHGVLLSGLYQQTLTVWRPEADAHSKMWLMGISQLLLALALTWFYTKGYEADKPGAAQGARFGFYAAILLIAAHGFVWYVVLPIPFVLNLGWLASCFFDSLFAGVMIGIIYRE